MVVGQIGVTAMLPDAVTSSRYSQSVSSFCRQIGESRLNLITDNS